MFFLSILELVDFRVLWRFAGLHFDDVFLGPWPLRDSKEKLRDDIQPREGGPMPELATQHVAPFCENC